MDSSRPGAGTTRGRGEARAENRRRSWRARTTRARWSRITSCSASSSCGRKSYKKAVAELRLADQTQLHVKYLLAQALEGAGATR